MNATLKRALVFHIFVAWLSVAAVSQTPGLRADTSSRRQVASKGIASGFEGSIIGHEEEFLSDLNKLGVSWIRMDFDWSQIQPNNADAYNTTDLDRQVRELTAHGIQVLGLIDYAPSWANGHAASKFYAPRNPKEYARFAAYLAGHFGPMGVHTWEIWNEPNGGVFWLPKADPVAYTRLLKATYPAIKQADPAAKVITGGLSPACDCKRSLTPMTFLRRVYGAGAKNYFDDVGHHPYTYPRLANAKGSGPKWWKGMYSGPRNLRSIMSANGDGNKKIWMTEYGAPTNGGKDDVTEETQANMLKIAFDLHATYSWAGPLFWYTYRDAGTNPKDEEDWFGLIRADGTSKPAYSVFKEVEH